MDSRLVAASALAMAVTLFAIFSLRPRARKLGLVDRPDERKHHRGAIPLVGGLCFFAGTLVGLSYLGYVDRFVGSVMVSAVFIVLAGAFDDLHSLGVRARLAIEAGAAALVIAATGVYVNQLGVLPGIGELQLGVLGIPFTILAVVGLINAFNMLDGVDGLAASVAMTSIAAILLFDHGTGVKPGALWMLQVLFAALIPYLCVNLGWPDGRKIFMGDAGSMLLGFFLAFCLVYLSQGGVARVAPVDVLWCVALPVIDTLSVIWRRVRLGRSPFRPDRLHLHHLLRDAGFGDRAVLALMVAGAAALALLGYALQGAPVWVSALAFGAVFALHAAHAPRLIAWAADAFLRKRDDASAVADMNADTPAATPSEPVKALCVLSATRDAIRMAPIAHQLNEDARFDATVCLAPAGESPPEQVLQLFDVEPDRPTGFVDDRDPGGPIATFGRIDQLLDTVRPDVMLVPGDGPATLPAVLAARSHDIPVVCIDGNGSDGSGAEPTDDIANRMARAMASMHLTTNESAGNQLRSQGVPAERLVMAGDPALETLRMARARISSDPALERQLRERFAFAGGDTPVLLVLARTGIAGRFPLLPDALATFARRHPQVSIACPAELLEGIAPAGERPPNLHRFDTDDYLASVFLLERASAVLATDDCAAEAETLGKPVLTLVADDLETDREVWLSRLERLLQSSPQSRNPPPNFDDGSSARAVEALAGLRFAARRSDATPRSAGPTATSPGAPVAMHRLP